MAFGHNKNIGSQGEKVALQHYRSNGYKLVEKNWSVPIGEIDLIFQKKNLLVFVEVKTSTSYEFGNPGERITLIKQEKLVKLANLYLAQSSLSEKIKNIRIDAAEVIKTDENFEINIIENIIET